MRVEGERNDGAFTRQHSLNWIETVFKHRVISKKLKFGDPDYYIYVFIFYIVCTRVQNHLIIPNFAVCTIVCVGCE